MSESPKYGPFAMTPEELDAFLAATDVVALASLRRDGSPFVVPVGFDWDGEYFSVTIARDHAGVHRLRRDPRVSLSAGSHPAFPTKFVVVEGIAEEDPEQYFEHWISVGRVVFRIRVVHLASFDGTKAPKGGKYSAGTKLPTDSSG